MAPSAAAAGPTHPIVSPSEEACPIRHIILSVSYVCAEEFTVQGTDGYTITVSADPGFGEVELSAEAPGANALYMVKGKVTPNSIRANLGKLGRIAVHFVPSGRERTVKVPPKCLKNRPPSVSARLGHFVGTIDFHGERGYTKVRARSAAGGIGDPLAVSREKIQCEFSQSKSERRREQESVALQGSPRKGLSFTASPFFAKLPSLAKKVRHLPPRGDRLLFFAFAYEKAGKITIIRSAGALGESRNLLYDDSLTTATVSAPAAGPFSGSAGFVRAADGSTSLTGTLAVELPGLGTVALTGGEAELATQATLKKQLEEKLAEELKK
ncbi:MAG TPA: hypothetical protein VMH33_13805 [Solirubrobacterales bacterium]|nr:hypothetical protein [Solirubrobacterales bacterium]